MTYRKAGRKVTLTWKTDKQGLLPIEVNPTMEALLKKLLETEPIELTADFSQETEIPECIRKALIEAYWGGNDESTNTRN